MILDDIIRDREIDYKIIKKEKPLAKIIKEAKALATNEHKLYDLCMKKDFIFICECKMASPSKGIIEPNYNPDKQSKLYIEAGADCISCLTEPRYFKGNDSHLLTVIENAKDKALVLRKDFIFSKYQIYESKILGADIILLICKILDEEKLKDYLDLAHSLGLSCLVETHNEKEIDMAKRCGAKVIGVNNRNLNDFSVDNSLVLKLRLKYPELIMISESGIKDINDVKKVKNAGLNGVLIGEALMRSEDPKALLEEFKKC